MFSNWLVHKFGGTSVADAKCLENVKEIIETNLMASNRRIAVVVSAMGGKPKVTDMLLNTVKAAASRDDTQLNELLEAVRVKHMNALNELESLCDDDRTTISKQIESDILDIKNLLRAVSVMRSATPQIAELVSGYGETWSARILTKLLQSAGHNYVYVDARDILRVDENGANHRANRCGAIAWEESQALMNARLEELAVICKNPKLENKNIIRRQTSNDSWSPNSGLNGGYNEETQLVITGYIASTMDGAPTTLKRDGSDYSASIFGKLLNASEVHIWTDVDGVLSADPRRVPEAFSLEEVTYEEAMELAYFGAKVLHPKTMTPAIDAGIPLFIRNTFNPDGRGTRIGPSAELARKTMMAGFTTVDNVAVINVCGTGMLGVPGVVFTAAGALRSAEISVRLIAQSSSEMSIALAIDADRIDEARTVLLSAYDKELRGGEIADIEIVTPCAIIAAVAQSLSNEAPGRFYDALGRCGIPLVAAAQGCDERNLSAVVHARDARRALRAVHSAFLSHNVVALALVGAGFIGGHLIDAIAEAERMLLARFNVKIRICALVNSDVMALAATDGDFIDLRNWRDLLKKATTESDFDGLVEHLEAYRAWVPDVVVVDASYSLAVAEQHAIWLRHKFHVVNANSRALAGPLDLFEQILLARDAAGPIMYCSESCVGGGLPVIDTLRNLVLGGDIVQHVECVISASMSFIFSLISPPSAPEAHAAKIKNNTKSEPLPSFKDAVKTAWVMGLLENEPFLDLSGQDAATKLLALGRELGLALQPQHIVSEPIDGLRDLLEHDAAEEERSNLIESKHVRNFRQQYQLWRGGCRTMLSELERSNSDSLHAESDADWVLPVSHERAIAIAGGAIENGSVQHQPRINKITPGSRLFGWSAVELYNAESLEEGYSRTEGSGRALPIDNDVLDYIDKAIMQRIKIAHSHGKVLRYVGRINVATGDVKLGLEEVEPNHAFAQLTGPELCVRFFTERYRAIPLTVNGPLFAAGMASGVFSELLRVVRHCSGHDRPYHLQLRRTRSMSRLNEIASLSA